MGFTRTTIRSRRGISGRTSESRASEQASRKASRWSGPPPIFCHPSSHLPSLRHTSLQRSLSETGTFESHFERNRRALLIPDFNLRLPSITMEADTLQGERGGLCREAPGIHSKGLLMGTRDRTDPARKLSCVFALFAVTVTPHQIIIPALTHRRVKDDPTVCPWWIRPGEDEGDPTGSEARGRQGTRCRWFLIAARGLRLVKKRASGRGGTARGTTRDGL